MEGSRNKHFVFALVVLIYAFCAVNLVWGKGQAFQDGDLSFMAQNNSNGTNITTTLRPPTNGTNSTTTRPPTNGTNSTTLRPPTNYPNLTTTRIPTNGTNSTASSIMYPVGGHRIGYLGIIVLVLSFLCFS